MLKHIYGSMSLTCTAFKVFEGRQISINGNCYRTNSGNSLL